MGCKFPADTGFLCDKAPINSSLCQGNNQSYSLYFLIYLAFPELLNYIALKYNYKQEKM